MRHETQNNKGNEMTNEEIYNNYVKSAKRLDSFRENLFIAEGQGMTSWEKNTLEALKVVYMVRKQLWEGTL